MTQLNHRQHYLLALLAKQSEPQSREAISEAIASVYPVSKVTLIRDLAALAEEGLVVVTGSGPGTKYKTPDLPQVLRPYDEDSYFDVPQDDRILNPQDNSAFFKELADTPLLTAAETSTIDTANVDFQKRLKTREPDVYRRELHRFTVELAWKSSRIEGNTYSLLDTDELLKTDQPSPHHTMGEAQMILNHKSALDTIMQNAAAFKAITLSDIMSIHQELTQNLAIESGIRRQPVGITGTNYLPLGNEFALREHLEGAIKLANGKRHPVEAAIVLSGLIAYLQPFVDGNKRTARLVGNAILLAHNYAALSYRGVNEVAYKKSVLLIGEQHSFASYKQMFLDQFIFATEKYFL